MAAARRVLERNAGGPVEITQIDLSGRSVCGWTQYGGAFLLDGETVIRYPQAPERFEECGDSFVEPTTVQPIP